MTSPNVTPPPKRLHILDNEEIEALYGRPCFTGDERIHVFTLTQPEKDLLASFTHLPIQLYFLLQLGYFKAKQLSPHSMHAIPRNIWPQQGCGGLYPGCQSCPSERRYDRCPRS